MPGYRQPDKAKAPPRACPRPLPCLPLATSATLEKTSPHWAPSFSSPPTHTMPITNQAPSAPQMPPNTSLSSHSPLPLEHSFLAVSASPKSPKMAPKLHSNTSAPHHPLPGQPSTPPSGGRFPQDPHMPPPPPLQALCLHPSPISNPPCPRPLPPPFPGPWLPLPPDHLALFCLLVVVLLPPALPGAAARKGSVPPRKRPTWEQECAER